MVVRPAEMGILAATAETPGEVAVRGSQGVMGLTYIDDGALTAHAHALFNRA